MTRRLVNLGSHSPILDIVSLGRAAPGSWTPAQLALISRTVSRAPEVIVKVSGGARSLRGAAAHFGYISRGLS